MNRRTLRRAAPALPLLVVLVLTACSDPALQKAEARLEADRAAIDFGERPVLDEATETVLLTNVGRAPLELSVRYEGDDAFTWAVDLTSLDGGAVASLAVTFRATEQKPYAGKLFVTSNEVEGGVVKEISLAGVGSTVASALIEPESLDFGRVGEGRAGVKRVKITSVGTADLKVKTIAFKAGSSAAYAFVGSTRTPQVLAKHVDGTPDAFAEVTVKFAPTADKLETAGVLVLETTDPQHALVEIPLTAQINRQPVAVPGADRQVAPLTSVSLDGSSSNDPDGDVPLTFKWTLATQPQGSAAKLTGADTATPSLTPDQPGAYGLDLVVTDSAGLPSKPARVTIVSVAADKLVVQLIWDHPLADLDLHLLRPGDQLGSDQECSWEHPHPDWGVAGDTNDDPAHLGDKLSGFGPEYVVFEEPPEGPYRIVVDYVSSQGSATPALRATVRVYMYGAIQRELDLAMNAAGESWDVGTVTWPTGLVQTPAEGATP
jgi:hypothetical protein